VRRSGGCTGGDGRSGREGGEKEVRKSRRKRRREGDTRKDGRAFTTAPGHSGRRWVGRRRKRERHARVAAGTDAGSTERLNSISDLTRFVSAGQGDEGGLVEHGAEGPGRRSSPDPRRTAGLIRRGRQSFAKRECHLTAGKRRQTVATEIPCLHGTHRRARRADLPRKRAATGDQFAA